MSTSVALLLLLSSAAIVMVWSAYGQQQGFIYTDSKHTDI